MKKITEPLRNYLQGVRKESKRISWPPRSALKQLTIFVLVLVTLLAVFTGIIDAIFSRLVQLILK